MIKIDHYNPVVPDWTPECQAGEIRQRQECDFCLYVVTPKMTGVYTIAEVVDDSNKHPDKTLFCVLAVDGDSEFSRSQWKSLMAVAKMILTNKAYAFYSLPLVAAFLNREADLDGEMTQYAS
jgi:hypothetical protein